LFHRLFISSLFPYTTLFRSIIMAFIAALFGKPNFDSIGLDIGDGRLLIGTFLTALVNLVIVAAAVFFFIVKPVQAIKDRQKKEGDRKSTRLNSSHVKISYAV